MKIRVGAIVLAIAGLTLPLVSQASLVHAADSGIMPQAGGNATGLHAGSRIGNSIIIEISPGSLVIANAPGVDKGTYNAQSDIQNAGLAAYITAPTPGRHGFTGSGHSQAKSTAISPDGYYNGSTANMSGRQMNYITPPGGSNGPVGVQFGTSNPVSIGCCDPLTSDSIEFSGWAESWWGGSNPYVPTSIGLAETYSATGLQVSISIPSNAVGFSGGGSAAYWNKTVSGYWSVNHNFPNAGPVFTSHWLWSVGENATAEAQFGPVFDDTAASDAVAIP